MATIADIRNKARRIRQSYSASRLTEATLVEVENDDSVTSVKVTDEVNMVWALTLGEESRLVQAHNTAVNPRADMPVWLRRLRNGDYEVAGLRAKDGTEFYGEVAATVGLPEIMGRYLTFEIPSRNLLPGRVRLSESGGMYVYVEPFFDANYFGGADFDLTSYIPASANTKAWVKIWYDPNSAVLGATAGTAVSSVVTLLPEDLDDIVLSDSYIPLAALVIPNGTTAITTSMQIEDIRRWIAPPAGAEQYMPVSLSTTLIIPANRQVAVRRLNITAGGSLSILTGAAVDIF